MTSKPRRTSARAMLAALAATLLAGAACRATLPRPVSVNLDVNAPSDLPADFRDAFVLVNVRLEGEAVEPFLLDTGSDISAVDRRLVERLHLVPESPAIARGTTGIISTSIVRGRRLDAGPLSVDSPVFLVLDLSEFEWVIGTRLGGILGLDLLREVALTVDAPAHRVAVTPSASQASPRGVRLPLRISDSLCGIDVELDGVGPIPLLVDTGMSSAASIGEESARSLGLRGPDGQRPAPWHVSIAGGSRVPGATFDRLRVGERTLRFPDVVYQRPAGGFAGAIGAGALRFFRFTLDVAGGTLDLADASPSGGGPSTMRGAGVEVEVVDHGLRVLGVVEDSPAARAGLRAGDLMTRVAGRPAQLWGRRALRLWPPPSGAPLRVSIADDGFERDADLER